MINMSFNRWDSQPNSTTWPYKVFMQHHKLLNDLYWSQVPTYEYVKYLYLHKNSSIENTYNLLKVSPNAPDARFVREDTEVWFHDINEFMNWTRLNCLVAINSYLEIYVSSVVTLALDSDRGNIFGLSQQVDGFKTVKDNLKNKKYEEIKNGIVTDITKGEWTKRIAKFKEVFHAVPPSLKKHVKELERIRILRNNVAHAFGRNIDQSRETNLTSPLSIERLAHETLKKYMKIIRIIVREIDQLLLKNHIGEYEALYCYHTNKFNLNLKPKLLKELLQPTCGLRSTKFCAELINYYNRL